MRSASTFTSYINAELPNNLDGTWQRYEQLATRTFSNIEKRAEQASRAVAGLAGGRGAGGIGAPGKGLATQARQMRAVDDVNKKLARSSQAVSKGFDRQSTSMRRVAGDSQRVARGLSAVSTSLNIVQGPLGPLAGRVSALSRAVSELTGFRLGIAGVASSLFVLGSVGNSYATLEARLRGAFIEQGRVNSAMRDIAGIATNARAALDPVAETYVKITKASEQFAVSQERSARLVETITKAAVLSGGSTQSQEAGLTQFGQGFASGNLAGDELKSVRENTFVLAQAIANGLGIATGELKEFAAQGKLTSQELVRALEIAAVEIDARFAAMPKTLGQSLTELRNQFTLMVGQFDQTVGFSRRLAAAISSVSAALPVLAAGAVGLGAAFASIKFAKLISDLNSSIGRYVEMNKQVRTLAQTRKLEAEQQVAFTKRSIAGLNQQQAEIRETIALRQREADLAREDLRRVRNDPTASSGRIKAALRAQVEAQKEVNAARRAGVGNAAALEAAEKRLETTTRRLNRATAVAAGRVGVFRTAVRNLIGAINPLGIAIGIATTALIMMGTKASSTERILESAGDTATGTARKMLGLAEANYKAADSFIALARAQSKKATADARAALQENNEELADRLESAATRILTAGGGRNFEQRKTDAARLTQYAKKVRSGTADVGKALGNLEILGERYKDALDGNFVSNFFQGETNFGAFVDNAVANTIAAQELKDAKKAEIQLEKDIVELQEKQAAARARGEQSSPISTADLRTQAAAEGINSSTAQLEAATRRRNEAFRRLDEEFEVTGGKVSAGRAEEYKARAAEITAAYDQEKAAIRGAAQARTAAAASNRAAAQQEIKDNRELAASRLQEGLLALEQSRPTLSTQEYYQARIKLLETYDAEIEAADETAVNVSKAVAQMIRDTRQMQKEAASFAEKRRDILGGYEDAPKALIKARDQIDDLTRSVGEFIELTEGNFTLYTAEMAANDAANIMAGVLRPLRDATDQAARFREISSLRLEGFDLEADALERALDLQDQIGALTRDQFETIVSETEEQQRINSLLAQRERLLEPILASVTATRDGFEEMLVNLPEEGGRAITGFLKDIQMQMRRIYARKISEALFGGVEDRMKKLLGTAEGGVDAAYEYLAKHAKATGEEFESVATSGDTASTALDRLAASADAAANSLPGGVGGSTQNTINDIINSGGASPAEIAAHVKGLFGAGSAAGKAAEAAGNVIVVNGRRQTAVAPGGASAGNVAGSTGLRALGDTFGDALNGVFGTDFFGGMGDVFAGAGEGMFASGIADMFGVTQSNTGAAIGGALGSLIPIPGGSIIGGLIGGTIGGLFKKKKYGTAVLTGPDGYSTVGNNSDYRGTADGLGGRVLDGLDQIAQAVGGTVGSFNTSIGVYKGNYRVSSTGWNGKLNFKGQSAVGLQDFGDDAEGAIAAAIADAVADGAIKGISAASQRILRSGQDLQKAIEKVVAIESIPKRLQAIKDPVGFAIGELNREFETLIGYLKEGGATAEQFSQAQELYDLERARAIEQATQNAIGAIEQFMEDMISSSSSPLNKRTVYDNAKGTLDDLAAKINAGEVVDQNALTAAAANFQDASRELYGSSGAFFSDFDMLYNLLGRARDNAMVGGFDEQGNPTLPASPFDSDPTVRSLIDQYRGVENAIGDQTDTLADILTDIRDALGGGGSGGYSPTPGMAGDGVNALPGFGGGGGTREYNQYVAYY